jgi:hypothetical protein
MSPRRHDPPILKLVLLSDTHELRREVDVPAGDIQIYSADLRCIPAGDANRFVLTAGSNAITTFGRGKRPGGKGPAADRVVATCRPCVICGYTDCVAAGTRVRARQGIERQLSSVWLVSKPSRVAFDSAIAFETTQPSLTATRNGDGVYYPVACISKDAGEAICAKLENPGRAHERALLRIQSSCI